MSKPQMAPALKRDIEDVLRQMDPVRAAELEHQMKVVDLELERPTSRVIHALGSSARVVASEPPGMDMPPLKPVKRRADEPADAEVTSDHESRFGAIEKRLDALENNARGLASSALPSARYSHAAELGAQDRLTAVESQARQATGVTFAQAHAARDLRASRTPNPATGPRITDEDRAVAKHTGCSEQQLQAAAELRFKRFGT